MLTNICIVLVETSHPGNIGATARAMKTMGLTDLRLVNPKYFPSVEATTRAAGADELLAQARVMSSLSEAVADCELVLGTTARQRAMAWPQLLPRAAAERVLGEASSQRAAFVFGRESAGLTNEELQLCHYALTIPANPEYSSLNLAAAVQIVCYELYSATASMETERSEKGRQFVAAAQMDGFFEHCAAAMRETGFFDAGNPDVVMRRLRRLFNRTRLDENEYNILRGFFRQILLRCKNSKHER